MYCDKMRDQSAFNILKTDPLYLFVAFLVLWHSECCLVQNDGRNCVYSAFSYLHNVTYKTTNGIY
jgi:hypothetical protein